MKKLRALGFLGVSMFFLTACPDQDKDLKNQLAMIRAACQSNPNAPGLNPQICAGVAPGNQVSVQNGQLKITGTDGQTTQYALNNLNNQTNPQAPSAIAIGGQGSNAPPSVLAKQVQNKAKNVAAQLRNIAYDPSDPEYHQPLDNFITGKVNTSSASSAGVSDPAGSGASTASVATSGGSISGGDAVKED